MKLTPKQRHELSAQGALISVRGREYIAIDALGSVSAIAVASEPPTETPKPVQKAKDGNKVDMEGSGGSR